MKYTFIILFAAVHFAAYAQNRQSVVFNETTHSFGQINEENGTVDYEFTFTNNGSAPLVILGVNASCGCTTSGYTTDTVPPGGKGFVKASYNPYNRPGAFKKSLNVTTNSDPNIVTLYIEGSVKPKARNISEEFPVKQGALRLKFASLNMGNVKNNALTTKSFDVYNDSDKPVSFSKNIQKPKNVVITFEPHVIPPKSIGSIVVTYDPTKSELGYITNDLVLQTNEPDQFKTKNLRIVATVEEYFPPMTAEELARAPRIAVDKRQHDFGSTTAGSGINASFTLTNIGHNPLLIRGVKSHCDCLTVEIDKESLNRNEQAVIRAKFNTAGRQGNQLISITIFTNDPQEPMKVVRVRGRLN
jgi:hypothetical protein